MEDNSIKAISHTLLGILLLVGTIVCFVGCEQGVIATSKPVTVAKPITTTKPESGTFWESVQNDDWTLMRRWIEYDRSLVNSRGRYKYANGELLGITPLMVAAIQGNTEMVKFLCDNGADPNMRNERGGTVLHSLGRGITRKPQHVDILKYLIDRGADVNAKTTDGWTPLDSFGRADDWPVIKAIGDVNAEMIRILRAAGGRAEKFQRFQ
jgi:hypothetical protein